MGSLLKREVTVEPHRAFIPPPPWRLYTRANQKVWGLIGELP